MFCFLYFSPLFLKFSAFHFCYFLYIFISIYPRIFYFSIRFFIIRHFLFVHAIIRPCVYHSLRTHHPYAYVYTYPQQLQTAPERCTQNSVYTHVRVCTYTCTSPKHLRCTAQKEYKVISLGRILDHLQPGLALIINFFKS